METLPARGGVCCVEPGGGQCDGRQESLRPPAEINVFFTRHQALTQRDPIATHEIIMARLRGGNVVLCLWRLGQEGVTLERT